MAVDNVDAVREFVPVLKNIEAKSIKERTEHAIIDDTLVDWLGVEFAREVKKHAAVKNREGSTAWYERASLLSQEFAITVDLLHKDIDTLDRERQDKLSRNLASKIKGLEGIIGHENMVGWMSNLTFADLLKKAIKKDNIKLREFFATPHDDAVNGIDFVLDYEKVGIRYVNLVQLKSNGKGKSSVEGFDESNMGLEGIWVGSKMMKQEAALQMFRKRDRIMADKKPDETVVARCFFVDVPSYDSSSTNYDVFGRVSDADAINDFVQDAIVSGLVPSGGK